MFRSLGWLLHAGAGGVVGLLFVFGWSREVSQHDLDLTLHQWLEALAWPVGGITAIGLGLCILAAVRWARRGDD